LPTINPHSLHSINGPHAHLGLQAEYKVAAIRKQWMTIRKSRSDFFYNKKNSATLFAKYKKQFMKIKYFIKVIFIFL